jgi:hypothetical protein
VTVSLAPSPIDATLRHSVRIGVRPLQVMSQAVMQLLPRSLARRMSGIKRV